MRRSTCTSRAPTGASGSSDPCLVRALRVVAWPRSRGIAEAGAGSDGGRHLVPHALRFPLLTKHGHVVLGRQRPRTTCSNAAIARGRRRIVSESQTVDSGSVWHSDTPSRAVTDGASPALHAPMAHPNAERGISLAFIVLLGGCSAAEARTPAERATVQHVLLLSVDVMHANDLARWVESHPDSALARLSRNGVTFSDARSPTPSDSFPGLLALVTGGTPRSTGVYYDDSYDRTLYPPGSNCQGNPGTECTYFEIAEADFTNLFSPLNPANLPHAKDAQGHCLPVYPHDFIKVNTVFEVIRAAGGHTAWSDKHPAYDLVNGPSGTGVEDLYTPEINSLIANGGIVNGVNLSATLAQCDGTTNSLPLSKVGDYTTCEPAVMAYDDVQVQAVVNQINGKSADGTRGAPVPNLFGMNFQEVSVGQKLPVGGYADAAGTPTALLAGAIAHVDASLGRMVSALEANHLLDSTLIVVSAKHGQSPIDRGK